MKKIVKIITFSVLAAAIACTPKTGGKMSDVKPASSPNNTEAAKAAASASTFRKNAPTAAAAPSINIGKADNLTLDNGLKVIVVENHKLPKVSFQLFVDADPVLEKDAAGYTDMMGELLAKGTTTRTKAQIDEEVDFLGATLSTNSNGMFGGCLSRHSDKLLALMSDVLLNPTFPEEELKKTKTRTQSELAQRKDNANVIAGNVASILRNSKAHPYGEITTEATLEKVTLEQIKAYYNTYFKPNVSYLVIVGDVTKPQAEKFAKQYFGKWQRGNVPAHTYPQPTMPEKTQVDFVNKPGAVQSVISITYPVNLATGEPDAIKSRLMNTILGGYFNSRINANLREARAYTYGARSSLSPNKVVGNFSAGASVRNAVTDSSVIQLLYEFGKLRDEKVPANELQLVKNVLTGQFSMNLEKPETVAEFALNAARFNLPADYYEKYLERLNAVTADEVQAMAKKYIRPDRAHILVVGNKDEVADKLKQFSLDNKVNFYDSNGDPIQKAGKIPDGVTAETVLTDYINAIGGKEKVAAIKSTVTTTKLSTGDGPEFNMTTWQNASGKYAMDVQMGGQSMSKQVFDGKTGKEYGMGGSQPIEGAALEDAKENAKPCKEAYYKQNNYKLMLKGIEEINGKKVYVMQVIRPDGKESTEYYDMASSLKIREVAVNKSEDGGEAQTISTDFGDYKAVNGVLFPYTMTINGMLPVPLKGTVTDIKVNSNIADSVFEVK